MIEVRQWSGIALWMRRRRNPSIESRHGNTEVPRHVSGRNPAGEQPLGSFDLAFCHLPLTSASSTELARDF